MRIHFQKAVNLQLPFESRFRHNSRRYLLISHRPAWMCVSFRSGHSSFCGRNGKRGSISEARPLEIRYKHFWGPSSAGFQRYLSDRKRRILYKGLQSAQPPPHVHITPDRPDFYPMWHLSVKTQNKRNEEQAERWEGLNSIVCQFWSGVRVAGILSSVWWCAKRPLQINR